MEVYDIGSTRDCYIGLFEAVCNYFHCTTIFFEKHKYRKAEVYGSAANRRQALVMYEFWKNQCIALGKRANEAEDELLSKSPFSQRLYSRRRVEDMVFGAFTRVVERAITNPEDISKGRVLPPILVEGKSQSLVPHDVGGDVVEKKEWLPEYYRFFWITIRWYPPAVDLVKEHMSLDARPLEKPRKAGANKITGNFNSTIGIK